MSKSKKRNRTPSIDLLPSSTANKNQSVSELSGWKLFTEYALLIVVAGVLMSIFTIAFEHAITAVIKNLVLMFR